MFKKTIKILLGAILLYIIAAFVFSYIPINNKNLQGEKQVYLHTNGIHLDIVIPIENISNLLKKNLIYRKEDKYLSFGWGDKDFYLNTPQWKDLTFKTAFKAMFLPSKTLMHVTRYQEVQDTWVVVKLSEEQLQKMNMAINNTFAINKAGHKLLLADKHYKNTDNFYRANGSYSIFKTCNTWANSIFKQSNLQSSVWTPFDFGLMHFYE